jgi:protein-tyrosine phosphatase
MTQRILPLEGVSNFRDYGGYATMSGAKLKTGLLYRSGHHGRASDADLDAMAALGIATVVDLRRKGEREREPSRRHKDFAGQVIDNDIGDTPEDPWHVFVRNSDLSAQAFRDHGLGYYRDAPFEERHIDLYSRYFRALGEVDGPVLIHCAAGKDRTGLLAALTHNLVGVHPDDIAADFLLTNQAVDYDRLIPMVSEMMQAETGRRPTPEAVRVAMGVDPDYLQMAFTVINEAHGSLDAYTRDVLGVDAALKAKIEARLLA